jgi:hypothetical protein
LAAIIIPGQSGTYRHLQGRVTGLLAESGLNSLYGSGATTAIGVHSAFMPLDIAAEARSWRDSHGGPGETTPEQIFCLQLLT